MHKRCVVITNPMIAANKSAEVTLSKFLNVISPVYDEIHVIGGNITLETDVKSAIVHSIPIKRSTNKIKRIADILQLQMRMARDVRRYARKDTPVYFWIGDKMIIPYWVAKMQKTDIRFFIYGNVLKEGRASKFTTLSARLIAYMANHANNVCVESKGVMNEWVGLVHNSNVRVLHLYTDIMPAEPIEKRANIIGMLCRLTAGKHVLESIEAFCQVHSLHPEYRLEIIGSGRQEKECRKLIQEFHAERFIRMYGWIEHDDVFEKTRRWKYLLFPSDTEGMPNSVLEMMGQGIPAIASPVGGVIDIITHGETGWLLNQPSVCEINSALLQAIESPCYSDISKNARSVIASEYSLSGAKRVASENC